MYQPMWQPFDLGAFDPSLAGETIQLLRNPTRSFRQTFAEGAGDKLFADVAYITHVKTEDVEPYWGAMDSAVFTWMFVPFLDADGLVVLPHVYKVWDDSTKERIKKLLVPLPDQEAAP